MKGMKLFDQVEVSQEEIAPVEVAPLDPVEMMETAEAFADIQQIEDEAVVAHEAIAIADTVVASLEAQVNVDKGLLADKASVNKGNVILSQETLKATAAILGANIESINLSSEAIEADPAEALAISVEAKDGFVKKVIDNIKLLFKKFTALLKKLYTKAVVAMTGVAKQAEKLKADLEAGKKDAKPTIELTEQLVGIMKANIGSLVIALGGSFDATYGLKLAALSKETDIIKDGSASIQGLAKAIKASIDGLKDEVSKADLEKEIKSAVDAVIIDDVVVKYDGMAVKSIVVVTPELKEDKYSKDAAEKVLKGITVKLEQETLDIKEFKITSVKYDDLINITGHLIKPAKNIKGFLSKVESVVKDVESKVEKLDDEAYMPAIKFGQVFVGNIAMDVVVGTLNNIKRTFSTVAALRKAAMAEEEKGESKEEEKKEKEKGKK